MNIFKQIINLIKPYIKSQLMGFILTILFSITVAASPIASKYLIDTVIPSNSYTILCRGLLIFFIVCVLQPIFGYLKDVVLLGISEKITLDIKNNLLNKVINAKMSYFDEINSGEIISRIMNDSREVGEFLTNIFIVLIKNIFILIIALIGMFYLSVSITLTVVIELTIFLLFNLRISKKFQIMSLEIQKSTDKIYSIINQIVTNIMTIKSLNSETEFIKKYKSTTIENYKISKKMRLLSSLFNNMANVIVICSICIIYGLGSVKVIQKSLTIGDIIALGLYFQTIVQPVYELINSNIQIKKIKPVLERINQLNNIDQELKDEKTYLDEIKKINIEDVKFSYGDKEILNNINISFPEKGFIGIIGPSGSGKSTLVKLLLGFYNVNEGKILIDNTIINCIDVNWLRKCISYVSQDTELFNMSIIDNIRISNPNISETEIFEVCDKLQLHEKISRLPKGYDTIITERVNLSGGEKQRLSIARSLLRKSNIFIFDEPTSSLDSVNENIVADLINELSKENLVILIAHRVTTLSNADMIYKLESENLKATSLLKDKILDNELQVIYK